MLFKKLKVWVWGEIFLILLLKNRGFYAGSADISAGKGIRKKLAMLEHHPGNL